MKCSGMLRTIVLLIVGLGLGLGVGLGLWLSLGLGLGFGFYVTNSARKVRIRGGARVLCDKFRL